MVPTAVWQITTRTVPGIDDLQGGTFLEPGCAREMGFASSRFVGQVTVQALRAAGYMHICAGLCASDVPACALPLSKSAGKEPTPCLCCGSGARVGVTTDATERERRERGSSWGEREG